MCALDGWGAPRFLSIFLASAESRFEGESPLPPQAGNAPRWAAGSLERVANGLMVQLAVCEHIQLTSENV
jgi:hypothetical protein